MRGNVTDPYTPERIAMRVETGRKRGYTAEYARLSEDDRATWVKAMFTEGKPDAEIIAATGLKPSWVLTLRRRMIRQGAIKGRERKELAPILHTKTDGESGAGVELDSGAYMRAVRRLGVAPPPSWRFALDLTPLPSRPVAIRSASFGGRCADEGGAAHLD